MIETADMISWCFEISLLPTVLGKSCWVCVTWAVSERRIILPGNRLASRAHLIWNFSKNKKARGTERQRAGGRRKVKRRQGLSKANPEQTLEAQQHLWCYFVITTRHPIILFLFSLAVRDNQCQLTLIIVIEFKINVVASMSVILYWYRKEICTPGVSCARLRIKKEFLTVNYR